MQLEQKVNGRKVTNAQEGQLSGIQIEKRAANGSPNIAAASQESKNEQATVAGQASPKATLLRDSPIVNQFLQRQAPNQQEKYEKRDNQ